jgi:hypothetical protein
MFSVRLRSSPLDQVVKPEGQGNDVGGSRPIALHIVQGGDGIAEDTGDFVIKTGPHLAVRFRRSDTRSGRIAW